MRSFSPQNVSKLFDKATLPPPEPDEAGATGILSLGVFDVMEAETLLKKFEEAGLRFAINRDDSPIRQMPPFTEVTGGLSGTAQMIEIFVHTEDNAKAVELMGMNHPV